MKFHDFHYSSNRTIKYLYLSEYFIVKKGLQKAKQLQTNKIFIKPDILDNLIVYLKGGIKMNKKGLSDVVTTVLIILLALAAIVIVWQAVKGTITSGSEQITAQTACMDADLSITKAEKVTAGGIEVTVTRGIDTADIKGIKVIVINSAGTSINSTDFTTVPAAGESKVLTVTAATYPTGSYTAKVAPKVGTTQCDVAATKPLTI